MKPSDALKQIQAILGVVADGVWGQKSQSALNSLIQIKEAPTWPFSMSIDGDDIVVNDVVITCFGGWGTGIADPSDNGNTASGMNTRNRPVVGVSVAMDGRQFTTLTPAEHRALDGAPIPRLLNDHGLTAWHTPVEVTIGDITFVPPDGIVDLGPALQASEPGQPHALDLTPLAAQHFKTGMLLRQLAEDFEARGSFRIIGGAKLVPA